MQRFTSDFSVFVRSIPQVAPVLLLGALFSISGCKSQANATPPAPQVTVAAAVKKNVIDWDEFTGRVEAIQSVEVRPRVTGYIDTVNFKEGSIVKKGDLLFVIDQRPYRADLEKAEADLARAKAHSELTANDVTRGEKLFNGRALSREEYEGRVNASRGAEADVRAAKAAVDIAKLNMEFTRVTAPIDGRVSKAEITAGNLVTGGTGTATLLTTVVSIDPMYVSFEGDEQAYLKYADLARKGERTSSRDIRNPVEMGLANEEGYPHNGFMTFVDNQVNPRTGTIHGRAVFDNKDGYLTPGLFARIKLLGRSEREEVLVDDRAIGTDQSQKFVYVVDDKKTVTYRTVKIGRMIDGLRIVTEGVAPGDLVIVNGIQSVRPGVVVTTEQTAMGEREPSAQRVAQNERN
jgi:RND family efflux transporter MFP subunit